VSYEATQMWADQFFGLMCSHERSDEWKKIINICEVQFGEMNWGNDPHTCWTSQRRLKFLSFTYVWQWLKFFSKSEDHLFNLFLKMMYNCQTKCGYSVVFLLVQTFWNQWHQVFQCLNHLPLKVKS